MMRQKLALVCILMLAFTGCLSADVQQRVSALEQKIQTNPTDAAAHRELGKVWFEGGHDKKAVEHLSMAAKLEPQGAETITMLGTAFARMGDYDNAIRVLTAGQQQGSAKNDFALGSALLGAGQYDEGVAAIKKALQKDPSLANMVKVAVKAPNAETVAKALQSASAQDQALEEVLEQSYSDLKDQIRQDVREQIAEDIILEK
ncbi:MAG: tetratricopeptide repeat protein [Candidatus Nitronauta litoralis]|uniref:Tetratricopeptide repeat protein n=1 Tax=Candidatus Nitronauta litoralis TaxID=2705533 RepID=A0A7T0FZY7_9BACT|nr:MAG: tetratricopeptide repeat protein [Candidatus Nitronauta litoralis]